MPFSNPLLNLYNFSTLYYELSSSVYSFHFPFRSFLFGNLLSLHALNKQLKLPSSKEHEFSIK
jgi:hypothetical protein